MRGCGPWTRWIAAVTLGAAALSIGCSSSSGSSSPGYAYGGTGSAGTSSGGNGASTQPMLVVVDPNQTLTAQPGQGVGVFTEYATGGHWHVWWTCDTATTGLGCQFDIDVSVMSGSITNLTSEAFEATDQLTQTSAEQVHASTTTTTGVEGLRFDSTAGATITLDARMNGLDDGGFLFFVQDGKVNGGYTHTVTDPLMLVPKTP
jgi:hypothetical protein